ncbi:MAG TPA: histidine phosphatase family protein [Gammaproteobacteria bacterium]|jgi:probable phosphoglycerate mutase|nr:phosphoglycerate mutase [Acidiferrobacteraceae bacterium]MDP6397750.1 histidine phosphatase family protein [Arenicellales bacterium]HCX88304.1 histidine phosphatase family protein [Gammaproteobacteria bacterium]MDP6552477.1 histidine phosphatase family protein [Arenicellales bacterium]MDP6853888.1 histidine phosphatase family protein [Arenicellales bacterium]|tara:strand:+ start:11246 stop:11833 length:588 start_codon:yes stop_codon:yes gene_type:complete
MSEILFIRHGPTEWNEAGRIQGRTDVPLSEAGRAEVASWALPAPYKQWRCFCSPLARARDTADLLGLNAPEIIDSLQEMQWGEWEGHTLKTLREIDPGAFIRNEDRGLDFRPPGGESPRDVRTRLEHWIATLSGNYLPAVAVCHKGLLRAALSLAADWDMIDDPPEKLRESCAHLYRISDGKLAVKQLNIALKSS